jgi:alpha-glucosidase (family GH31 glycosyl hydrolase)
VSTKTISVRFAHQHFFKYDPTFFADLQSFRVGLESQIDDLEDNGTKATVRIVPRIDYAKLSGGQEEKAAFGRRKGGTERPPARLFNPDEVLPVSILDFNTSRILNYCL